MEVSVGQAPLPSFGPTVTSRCNVGAWTNAVAPPARANEPLASATHATSYALADVTALNLMGGATSP